MQSLNQIASQILSQIEIDRRQIDIPNTGAPGESTVQTVINFAFVTAASIAAIVIILAGISFILSRGDPQKSTNARNAIIYALIGLAVISLSYSLVRLVVGQVS